MAILVDGQPQQELANGVVKLPFNSDYALRFRNKNNRRAVVKIYIDGENVSGGGYIVPANDFVDIKRHWGKDSSFKFVSLDSADAVEHGKNGPNADKVKGTIEARFHLEKEVPQTIYRDVHHHHHHDHHYRPKPSPWYDPYRPYWGVNRPISVGDTSQSGDMTCSFDGNEGGFEKASLGDTAQGAADSKFELCSMSRRNVLRTKTCSSPEATYSADCIVSKDASFSAPELKDGCTVEGTQTGQNFTSVWLDYEEAFTSLKVFLQGFDGKEEIQHVSEEPKKVRKTNKDVRLSDLEEENERLRKELAELENQKLKDALAEKKKPKVKRSRMKKTTQ
jgi:hypothetical protein